MKHYKHIIIAFFAVVVLGTPWLITRFPKSMDFVDGIFSFANRHIASVFFQESVTVAELRDKYQDSTKKRKEKVKIMIVPGHEADFGGTEYRKLKEREINVDLANELRKYFENDPHYEVIVARDNQDWNPALKLYFQQNWDDILIFYNKSKEEMLRMVNNGSVSVNKNGIFHNDAPKNVATRLYGINKWNNENGVDLAIHIHFNDYPRSNTSVPGKYSGLSIYVPERQYSNSTSTRAIADTIFKRLSKYNAVSDLPVERQGVIEEQELIAIGSYNTSDVPSMLIEYSYIYEPQITDDSVRSVTIRDLAFQTYLGVEDFFNEGNSKASQVYDTLVLPYFWNNRISSNTAIQSDVLALQTALIQNGFYPPEGRTKNDCPRTGTFGPCTMRALSNFQDSYGIRGENGFVGDETKRVLNQMYSVRID